MLSHAPAWASPPIDPLLRDGEIHIWCTPLDTFDMPGETTLSDGEEVRAEHLRFERDRRRFIRGRALLRALLGRYLHVEPQEVQFCYGPHGKPALLDVAGISRIRFNVSHSQGLALLAFARGREIGVDLEQVRPASATAQLVIRYFSAREQESLRALPHGQRLQGFYACWTRKEAFLKGRGEGLACPLDGFDVAVTPGEGARLLGVREHRLDAEHWSLRDLPPIPGYAAALAHEGPTCRLVCYTPSMSLFLGR